MCRSIQHCLAHGEEDMQLLQQDDDDAASKPCDATAEHIVVGLIDGNAEAVCITVH